MSGRRIVLTGGYGFLGWHTACRIRALTPHTPVQLGRTDLVDGARLAEAIRGADTILHLAGVNRAGTDEQVESGNVSLAERLSEAVTRNGAPVHVVYANSVQANLDNPYGRGKRRAAELLAQSTRRVGGSLADVLLPNLFGEHGRPDYNSFVATFAHAIASGRRPTVTGNRVVPLLHVQDAADALVRSAGRREEHTVTPEAETHEVEEILYRLAAFHDLYSRAEIPDLSEKFQVDLFNTYRSHLFPRPFPFRAEAYSDARGALYETTRSHGGTSQNFLSSTVPGATRGDHYHLRKMERFIVLRGEAVIRLRRLLHGEVVTFRLSGSEPSFVDMPTLWVHNIQNVGPGELLTAFWTDQLLDREHPDQYPERVEIEEAVT